MFVRENSCSIVTCRNHKQYKPGTAYFPLPSSPELAQKWLSFFGLTSVPTKELSTFKLCLEHFAPSQFQTTVPKLILKRSAVPSLNSPKDEPEKMTISKKNPQTPNNTQSFVGRLLYDDHNYTLLRQPQSVNPVTESKSGNQLGSGNTRRVSQTSKASPKKPSDGTSPSEKIKSLEDKLAQQKKVISALRGKIYREKKVKKRSTSTSTSKESAELLPKQPQSKAKKVYTEEAKQAIMEIYKLAPDSYVKFAKLLDLPPKQSIKLWNSQLLTKEKTEKPRKIVYRIRSRV